MTGPISAKSAGLIGTMPAGSFHAAGSRYVEPCLEDVPGGGNGHCFRPKGHGGRHAFIAMSGRLWRVWGEDVHKATRERGRIKGARPTVVVRDEIATWALGCGS